MNGTKLTFKFNFIVLCIKSVRYQKIIQYFLQGLLILGPVSITIYFIYVIFDKIDNILRPVINIPG